MGPDFLSFDLSGTMIHPRSTLFDSFPPTKTHSACAFAAALFERTMRSLAAKRDGELIYPTNDERAVAVDGARGVGGGRFERSRGSDTRARERATKAVEARGERLRRAVAARTPRHVRLLPVGAKI